ncbi:MAG: VWA domain-containing protein [Pseudomonadota bacterium]
MNALPAATQPFVEFASVLRANGFSIAPDQTIGFVEAVGLLGPRGIDDVRSAAIALLAIPHEREDEFEAIFRAFFYGEVASGVFEGEDEEVEAREATGATEEEQQEPGKESPGDEAAATERLARREFAPEEPEAVLARFARLAPARLPRRRSYRHAPSPSGRMLDMRRTLRIAARQDGEVFRLERRARKTRQRGIVLLIDISGSMSDRTDISLRFAHALARAADRFEAFTLGTRLTRITPALSRRNERQALDRVTALVADMDGGTRIGEALQTFLAVPRYAGFARGALVLVLSDGLERGGSEAMSDAVVRLSRRAWRIDWLSPLAIDGEVPDTTALAAIRPHLSALSDGTDLTAITDHVLNLGQAA